MINEAYNLVKKFQEQASQPISDFPCQLSNERREIRYKWMNTELEEFLLGDDIYKQADAMIDLLYYILGTLVEMGIEPDDLFMLIHEYNLKKTTNPLFDDSGKLLKPLSWKHPDGEIKDIICKMRAIKRDE